VSAPTLAEQVNEMVESLAAQAPPEALSAFGAEQADLDAAGVPEGVARPGTPMPDGDLVKVDGAPTRLGELRDGRAAVVVFYRGAWCPWRNITLRTYQAQLAGPLAERGVALIAISPQKPDGSLTMQETNALGYAVVSDPGDQIAAQLGILTAPSAETVKAQASLGLDVTTVNADGTTSLPMPTVAIVDAKGVLAWIDVHPNYATRTEPVEILDALATVLD
jgi:peroxiredoxin